MHARRAKIGYRGGAAGFIEWALEKLATSTERSVHNVTNMLIELAGEQAAVETYFLAWQRDRDDQGTAREVFLAGRYVDRFEKREGEWRVAERAVVYDWLRHLDPLDRPESDHFGVRQPQGAQFPNDPIYAAIARLSQGANGRE